MPRTKVCQRGHDYGAQRQRCPVCRRLHRQRWWRTHPEERREQRRRYRESHPNKRREQRRRWRLAHPEERRAKRRQWKLTHREQMVEYNRRRRAREVGSGGSVSVAYLAALLVVQRNLCAYCDRDLALGKHLDHVVPLQAGGRHEADNVLWVCPTCNGSKAQKELGAWWVQRGAQR